MESKEQALFNLPPVAPYWLTRAPLAQALGQVRFPLQARLGVIEGLADIQERLRDRYPYLEAQSGVELQIAPDAPAALQSRTQQFVFSADDGHFVFVEPGAVTLSVGAGYRGFADFRDRFAELLTVLHESVRVPRCDRIATRYLTLASTPPEGGGSWTDWFRPELLGWAGAGVLSDGTQVLNALNQVQLRSPARDSFATFPADVAGVVRHGLVPAGSGVSGLPPVQVDAEAYVLDFDFFCERPQPWDVERLLGQFVALHDQIDRFFAWALTPRGAEDFGYEEVGV